MKGASNASFLLTWACLSFILNSPAAAFHLRPSWRRSARVVRHAGLSSDVSTLLSEFGVAAERQEELVSKLKPLLQQAQAAAPADETPESKDEQQEIDVKVVRGTGGLGIEVDNNNVVGSNGGNINPDLFVGDRIVAIDGVSVDGQYVGKVLDASKAEYTFTVVRGGQSAVLALENVIGILSREAEEKMGLYGLAALTGGRSSAAPGEGFGAFAKRVEDVARSLEQSSQQEIDEEGMLGFWKLCYFSDETFAVPQGGLTRQGSRPLCRLVGHWQCLSSEGDNRMQTVEMIQNLNLGKNSVAALKGDWVLTGRSVAATYERLEYGGALENTDRVEDTSRCTFVGEKVRIMRREAESPSEGAVLVYLRRTAKEAGAEIKEWLDSPVPGVAAVQPRWEGYGISLGGPSPSASPL